MFRRNIRETIHLCGYNSVQNWRINFVANIRNYIMVYVVDNKFCISNFSGFRGENRTSRHTLAQKSHHRYVLMQTQIDNKTE